MRCGISAETNLLLKYKSINLNCRNTINMKSALNKVINMQPENQHCQNVFALSHEMAKDNNK